ncbi:DUF4837 family protein [bacterium]|nr:DUF4837 family protein [bacterium]
MTTRMSAVAILGAALFFAGLLAGCQQGGRETIISAVGSYGEIAVITTDAELVPALATFQDRLGPPETFVLRDEATYRFHHFEGKRWRDGRNYRNLIFVCRWGAGGPVQGAVEKLLNREALDRLTSGRGGVVTVRDPYFRNQLAFVAVARDPNALIRALNERLPALRDTLRHDIDRRIVGDNRRQGLMPGIVEHTWRAFGFRIELPAVFEENQARPDGFPGVEWLRTDGATRGLTVSWEDAGDPSGLLEDRDRLAALRARLGEAMHHEEIDPDSYVWSRETVAGRPAVKLAGNWASRRVEVGGPFWCYFVADEARGRVYCLDLLVYAPNREKMDYFRRLRALLETFSTTAP